MHRQRQAIADRMWGRLLIFVGVSGCVAVVAIAWMMQPDYPHQNENEHEGRHLDSWCEQVGSDDEDTRAEAVSAVATFLSTSESEEALRVLIAAMYDDRLDVCWASASSLAHRCNRNATERQQIVEALIAANEVEPWMRRRRPHLHFGGAQARFNDGQWRFFRNLNAETAVAALSQYERAWDDDWSLWWSMPVSLIRSEVEGKQKPPETAMQESDSLNHLHGLD